MSEQRTTGSAGIGTAGPSNGDRGNGSAAPGPAAGLPALADELGLWFWEADADGLYTRSGSAVEALLGYRPEELVGRRRIHDLFPEKARERLKTAVFERFGRKAPFRGFVAPHLGRDGRLAWLSTHAAPRLGPDGGLLGYRGLHVDVSAQKRTEARLRKENRDVREHDQDQVARLELISRAKNEWERTMDCVRDMVILADRDGRIKRVNQAVCDFTGLSFGEILGRDWEELLNEQHLNPTQFLADGTEFFHEPSGRWFLFNSRPFRDDAHGEVTGAAIMIYDVTEQKKAARELEEAYAKLKQTQSQILQQEKMASIGQLAAGVAHEINNPMGFIQSNLGTLGKYVDKLTDYIRFQDGILGKLDDPALREEIEARRRKLKLGYIIEDVRDLVSESLEGAERVKTIVQNLKSFSRVDQAEQSMADLNACLESTLNIVWNELKYKCTVEKDYGEIPKTKCFPQQLNQVFMNLLVNASHAIEKQGVIRIRTRAEGGRILVQVSDNGSGIPADKLDRIFEPFFTTKPVGKGTGLGLSIAYDIVKKHGGEITVESEVGRGTTFTVSLPVKTGGGDGEEAGPPADARGEPG